MRAPAQRAMSRRLNERGLALLDVLLGMAIFALIVVIGVQNFNTLRSRAYTTTASSDVKQIATALEAARTATGATAYPNPMTAMPAGVNLSSGVTAAGYAVTPDGEKFAVCAAHSGGAWALYDSSFGTVVATGKGASPASCTSPVVGAISPPGSTAAPTPSTPDALAAPENVTVSVVGDTATVAWAAVASATSYAVHVDASTDPSWEGTQTTATITDLAPGSHTIAVAASDGETTSVMSASRAFTATPVWSDVTGVTGVYGVTGGGDGNLYAVGTDSLLKINASGTATTIATGLTTPLHAVRGSDGNFYLTGGNTGNLYRVTPSGTQTTLATGLATATALAQAPDGSLYVGNGQGSLFRISLTGTVTTVTTGLSYIGGVTFGSDGNIYVSSNTTGQLTRVTPAGAKTTFASGLSSASAVVQTANGDFYVGGGASGNVYRVTATGTVSTFRTGLGTVLGIAKDGAGSLYVATRVSGDGRILKIS